MSSIVPIVQMPPAKVLSDALNTLNRKGFDKTRSSMEKQARRFIALHGQVQVCHLADKKVSIQRLSQEITRGVDHAIRRNPLIAPFAPRARLEILEAILPALDEGSRRAAQEIAGELYALDD